MSIIQKYIFTNVRGRKIRSAVTLLSILLSTTLLFVSFSIGESYESAQRKMAQRMTGNATLSVTAVHGGIGGSVLPQLPSIRASVGIVKGVALYHENGYYETMDLIGADLSSLSNINPPRLINGKEITGFIGNQVVLPDRFTSEYGIEKGDAITLLIGGEAVSLGAADIATYGTVFLRRTKGATALLPLDTLSGLLSQADGYTELLMEPAAGTSTIQLEEELTTLLPAGKYRVLEMVNEVRIATDARQRSVPFFLISFFSLTVSTFIIYRSYRVITLDQLPVIDTFRDISATQRAVIRILLLEDEVYGVADSLTGIPADVLALKLIPNGIGGSFSQGIGLPVVISPIGIALSLAVVVVISLLSAWFPARRASRLPVKDMVLGSVEEQAVSHRFIIGAGVLLFLIFIVLPRLASEQLLYPAGGCSLLGLIAAAILIVSLLTSLLSKVLERFYGAVLGNGGRLAARSMRSNGNISQNITLLFISISAVITITVVGDFVTAYVGDVSRDAKLQGLANGGMDMEFVEQIEEMERMELVLPLYVFKNQVEADGIVSNRLEGTDNLERYSSMMAPHYTRTGMKEQAMAAFAGGRALLLSESCLERIGFSVEDIISLSSGTGSFGYLIVGSFESRATDVETVIFATDAVSDFGASNYGFLAYTTADLGAIMVQIQNLFEETSNWGRTVEEFNQGALSTVGAFLQPMHGMTWFILLLATMGIINNLLINYIRKRRTTAMYKSVRLSNRQHTKMTLVGGFSSGLVGAAIAIFVSYMEIRTIFLVAGPRIAMTSELDAATFLMANVMRVMVTLGGSVIPILKSGKMKLMEEIKFE